MKRRKYLIYTSTIGLSTALAGCTAEFQEVLDQIPHAGHNEFGDTLSYEGLEITPVIWITSEEITFDSGDGETTTATSSEDTKFLLTKIEIQNTGFEAQELPKQGTSNSGDNVRFSIYSDGTSVPFWNSSGTVKFVKVSEEELILFEQAADSTDYVDPGVTIEGWFLNEISHGFEPIQTMLIVEWENPPEESPSGSHGYDLVVNDNPNAVAWEYREDARVSDNELPRYAL